MSEYTIPLGALVAAERAYDKLTPIQRGSSEHVAGVLLQAAAPYLAPLASQLGRRKLGPEVIAEIVRGYLAGTSTLQLASNYGVTPQTVRTHLRRQLWRHSERIRSGIPKRKIAQELRCTVPTLEAALTWAKRSAGR